MTPYTLLQAFFAIYFVNEIEAATFCPQEFYSANQTCLYFSRIKLSWTDSEATCAEKNASLADLSFLRNKLISQKKAKWKITSFSMFQVGSNISFSWEKKMVDKNSNYYKGNFKNRKSGQVSPITFKFICRTPLDAPLLQCPLAKVPLKVAKKGTISFVNIFPEDQRGARIQTSKI